MVVICIEEQKWFILLLCEMMFRTFSYNSKMNTIAIRKKLIVKWLAVLVSKTQMINSLNSIKKKKYACGTIFSMFTYKSLKEDQLILSTFLYVRLLFGGLGFMCWLLQLQLEYYFFNLRDGNTPRVEMLFPVLWDPEVTRCGKSWDAQWADMTLLRISLQVGSSCWGSLPKGNCKAG